MDLLRRDQIACLPSEMIELVTSFLMAQDMVHLYIAVNKVTRERMENSGAVQRVEQHLLVPYGLPVPNNPFETIGSRYGVYSGMLQNVSYCCGYPWKSYESIAKFTRIPRCISRFKQLTILRIVSRTEVGHPAAMVGPTEEQMKELPPSLTSLEFDFDHAISCFVKNRQEILCGQIPSTKSTSKNMTVLMREFDAIRINPDESEPLKNILTKLGKNEDAKSANAKMNNITSKSSSNPTEESQKEINTSSSQSNVSSSSSSSTNSPNNNINRPKIPNLTFDKLISKAIEQFNGKLPQFNSSSEEAYSSMAADTGVDVGDGDNHDYDPPSIWLNVGKLFPNLKHLIILSSSETFFLQVPQTPIHLHFIQFVKQTGRNLEFLAMDWHFTLDQTLALQLPPNLRSLHFCHKISYSSTKKHYYDNSFFTSLPLSLTCLELPKTRLSPSDMSYIPPNITCLQTSSLNACDISSIPKLTEMLSIGEVKVNNTSVDWAQHLPRSLKALTIPQLTLYQRSGIYDMPMMERLTIGLLENPIDTLPQSLTSLTITSTSGTVATLASLPPHVTYLSVSADYLDDVDMLTCFGSGRFKVLSFLTLRLTGRYLPKDTTHVTKKVLISSFKDYAITQLRIPVFQCARFVFKLTTCPATVTQIDPDIDYTLILYSGLPYGITTINEGVDLHDSSIRLIPSHVTTISAASNSKLFYKTLLNCIQPAVTSFSGAVIRIEDDWAPKIEKWMAQNCLSEISLPRDIIRWALANLKEKHPQTTFSRLSWIIAPVMSSFKSMSAFKCQTLSLLDAKHTREFSQLDYSMTMEKLVVSASRGSSSSTTKTTIHEETIQIEGSSSSSSSSSSPSSTTATNDHIRVESFVYREEMFNTLPICLTKLTIAGSFKRIPILTSLKNLIDLRINSDYEITNKTSLNFPPSLKHLAMGPCNFHSFPFKLIPAGLETLTMYGHITMTDTSLGQLPQGIKSLILHYCFGLTDGCINYLPSSIQHVYFGDHLSIDLGKRRIKKEKTCE